MKVSSILACLFAAILAAGCTPVVYRVSPDSSPKMGAKEARDAVELALSLRTARRGIESMYFDRDEVVAMYSEGSKRGVFTAGYGDISKEITKAGDAFEVRVGFQTGGGLSGPASTSYGMNAISWKSEEDARLFLDGIYALRQLKITPDKKASDAVELALSRIIPRRGIESMRLDRDEVVAMYSEGSKRGVFTAGYGDISKEITKVGDAFEVRVGFQSGGSLPGPASTSYGMTSISWKSEEDARLFLDGIYALRQLKIARDKGITAVASAPSPPLKKVAPPEEPARKEKPKQVESTIIAIAPTKAVPEPPKAAKSEEMPQKVISTVSEPAQAKPAPSASLPQAAPEPPKPAVPKKIPPKITITTPDISRTVSVAAKRTDITITGIAESNAGVIDVLVNGQQADLSEQGRFSSVVPLKIGQNKITVLAIDVFKNKATTQFAVNREAGKAAVMKAETIPPKITITAPDITRAVSVVAKTVKVTVTGIAESKSGIMDVSVNGQDAELDEQGRFSTAIPLKVGQNTITVTATDVLENKSTKQFAVNREAGIITAAIREVSPIDTEFAAAKYYALLIAVQDYDSGDISKLDFAVSDARGLGDILVSRYTFDKENVITLTNPDRRTIYKTLQSLRSKLTERDNLLIFYAGHGYWQEDMKQGFWLPRDASGINDPSDWIPNSTVRDYIKAIKARHVLLVADSCFSGGIFKTREAFYNQKVSMEKIYELPSRKAITSGSMKTVPDRSVFLEYLIKRLKDNRETYLDTQKLFASLREAVINNSPTHQTPLYGAISEAGDEGGDFIFVRRQ